MSRPPTIVLPVNVALYGGRLFLEAIAKFAPEAMTELAGIAAMPVGDPGAARWLLDRPTEAAVDAWATRWGIPYPNGWWMRQVRRHVKRWRAQPRHRGKWLMFTDSAFEPAWPTPPAWNANDELEADYRTRVDQYVADIKRLPGVVLPNETFRERDFQSLVLEHVAQKTIPDILEALQALDAPDEKTVRLRNERLAVVLGLTLRRRARGRVNRKK